MSARLTADRGALAIVSVCLISLLFWAEPGLTLPDGAGYYIYLPSTWIDGDLLFFNEWQRLGLIRNGLPVFKSATATNHLANHWTVGSALLWYPAFIAADLARAIVPSFAHFHRDGVVLPYNLGVVAASTVAGIGTLLAGYFIARRWFPARDAAIAAIATWLGSPLLWYSVRDAAMSHAVSALACALVVWLSLRMRERDTAEAALATGLAIGFATLVRIQNAAFVIVPLMLLDYDGVRRFLRKSHAFIAGGLLALLPELVVSTVIYGNPLGFASIGVRAIGWHPFERFWPLETLFSWYHGLFTWTPLAAVAIAGLAMMWRIDRRFAATALTMFLIQWITNATADRAFWAALSFGSRRFDNCLVFFIVGIALLARHTLGRVLILACAVWTMLLFYVAHHVDLNAYQSLAELVAAIPMALGDGIAPLMYIPPPLRTGAAATIVLSLIACAVVLLLLSLIPAGMRAGAISVYLAIMTAFLAWTGANGSRRIEEYWPLIERSRAFASIATREIGEQNLYENEILYLRKTGRDEEADRTAAELREMLRRRDAALRAAWGASRQPRP